MLSTTREIASGKHRSQHYLHRVHLQKKKMFEIMNLSRASICVT
jgi:hypothetical protein